MALRPCLSPFPVTFRYPCGKRRGPLGRAMSVPHAEVDQWADSQDATYLVTIKVVNRTIALFSCSVSAS